jgi:hypothetical protein
MNKYYALQWIKFLTIWVTIIIIVYSGYAYFTYSPIEKIKNKDIISNKIIKKHILSPIEKIEIKKNFSKIDNNFSNNIVHTNNGIIIERVKK